jgi:hypothetical protein
VEEQVLSPPAGAQELVAPYLALFHSRYAGQLAAVIFYGSCLSERTRSPSSTPDFFVVTRDGAIPAHSRLTRLLHPVLPPASQSAELVAEGRPRWFKYVYLDIAQLERLCSPAMTDLFTAGRLSKRVALVWASDPATARRVAAALAAAALSLLPLACALLPESFGLDDYIQAAVGLSYRSEYRIETPGKVAALVAAFPDHYQALCRRVLEVGEAGGLVARLEGERYRNRLSAAQREAALALLRRSRVRGLARWPKVLLTMERWSEAVLGKLERVDPSLRVPDRHRRHPFVFALPYLIMLLRRGYLRTQVQRW